ncbi:MAG: UTP--glucose-1-phosphate uridylyltransferase [Candidatus Kerfeldbacteria bacterium]|nr:UTP--glucose-1-phosphate uridylyltransferase [Candidatus Kerfeldbacteria bacterium]
MTKRTHKIRKAVIPVAGYGTRFLPATKAQPKEMLPLIDKPVIQFIVEEMVASGIEEIVLITSQNKRAIEDHFDRSIELEDYLRRSGKKKQLKDVMRVASLAKFVYVRQPEMRGNGHALLQARDIIGDEPFAFAYGDDVYVSQTPVTRQLISTFEKHHKSVVPVFEAGDAETEIYGVVEGKPTGDNTYAVKKIMEKPGPRRTRSRLITCGRYVFTPRIFDELEKIKPGKGRELWIADAVERLIKSEGIVAQKINGLYFDCGNKLEFAKATVYHALQHPDLKSDFQAYLQEIVK